MCKITIDKRPSMWYNDKFARSRWCARRQIKMIQYFNWLHSPMHFREHSVALLSRPNVHDLWRVRFRNFLTCGFYLGGPLISFTSFLCFNYSTFWLLCQHFFENFCKGFPAAYLGLFSGCSLRLTGLTVTTCVYSFREACPLLTLL